MCGVYAKSCVVCMQFCAACMQFCVVCMQFCGVCMQFCVVCMQFCGVCMQFCVVCMQFLWCVYAVFVVCVCTFVSCVYAVFNRSHPHFCEDFSFVWNMGVCRKAYWAYAPGWAYLTCGWTGVYHPIFRKAHTSNFQNLLSYSFL